MSNSIEKINPQQDMLGQTIPIVRLIHIFSLIRLAFCLQQNYIRQLYCAAMLNC